MDTTKDTAPPPTREARGLKLYREHAGEIEPLGKGRYTVPGCSGSGGVYEVDLAVFGGEESCSCPDHRCHKEPCKHLYAATIYRSKARTRAREEATARTKARASRASLAPLAAAL